MRIRRKFFRAIFNKIGLWNGNITPIVCYNFSADLRPNGTHLCPIMYRMRNLKTSIFLLNAAKTECLVKHLVTSKVLSRVTPCVNGSRFSTAVCYSRRSSQSALPRVAPCRDWMVILRNVFDVIHHALSQ